MSQQRLPRPSAGAFFRGLIWGLAVAIAATVFGWSLWQFFTRSPADDPFPYAEVLLPGGWAIVVLILLVNGATRRGRDRGRRGAILGAVFLSLCALGAVGLQIWAESAVSRISRGGIGGAELPSKAMLQATVAMEDQHFFEHRGFDWAGIHRALRTNARSGRVQQGGSTITQQLAKNMFLSKDRTVFRKLLEVPLTLALEHRLEKSEILRRYVAQISYGPQARGIGEAARFYFHTTPDRLNLAQSAILVGMVPHSLNVFPSPSKIEVWKNVALDRIASVFADQYGTADIAAARATPVEKVMYPFRLPLDRGATESVPKGWEGVLWFSYASDEPQGVPSVSPGLKHRLGAFALDARRLYSVVAIHHLGAFSDRTNRNDPGKMSAHAFGDALDISGFEFADGSRVDVRDHVIPAKMSRLRPLMDLLHKHFEIVVDWEEDSVLHQDHLHAEVRGNRKVLASTGGEGRLQ